MGVRVFFNFVSFFPSNIFHFSLACHYKHRSACMIFISSYISTLFLVLESFDKFGDICTVKFGDF